MSADLFMLPNIFRSSENVQVLTVMQEEILHKNRIVKKKTCFPSLGSSLYLSISMWCSGVGEGTMNERDLKVADFEAIIGFLLVSPFLTLCRRILCIISL